MLWRSLCPGPRGHWGWHPATVTTLLAGRQASCWGLGVNPQSGVGAVFPVIKWGRVKPTKGPYDKSHRCWEVFCKWWRVYKPDNNYPLWIWGRDRFEPLLPNSLPPTISCLYLCFTILSNIYTFINSFTSSFPFKPPSQDSNLINHICLYTKMSPKAEFGMLLKAWTWLESFAS